MVEGNLTNSAVWALRLALAGVMIAVDDPFRLAVAALVLSLQIPLQAGLARVAARRR